MDDPRNYYIAQSVRGRFAMKNGYIRLPELGAEAVPRSGSIVISTPPTGVDKQRFYIELNGPAFGLDKNDPPVGGAPDFDAVQLASYVDDCRKDWQREINARQPVEKSFLNWRDATEQPFMVRLSQERTLFDNVHQKLASSGFRLFQQIFLQPQAGMPDVARHLQKALRGRPCYLTVYSDTFFIPWGMLYVHPAGKGELDQDGSNADPDGFVGYRHVIEQATNSTFPPAAILPTQQKVAFGFMFDAALGVTRQQDYFKANDRLHPRVERRSKAELKSAFIKDKLPDQISYFYLHGLTNGTKSVTTQPGFYFGSDSVSANDINAWSQWQGRDGDLPTCPLMVFNACQSGQLRSLFYESFAFKLLDFRARGLLGPQIDIPEVFAEEYAKRFFDRLLKPNGTAVVQKSIQGRVGDIVRSLAVEFRDTEKNPLGLVYSLYKGAECYIAWNGTSTVAPEAPEVTS